MSGESNGATPKPLQFDWRVLLAYVLTALASALAGGGIQQLCSPACQCCVDDSGFMVSPDAVGKVECCPAAKCCDKGKCCKGDCCKCNKAEWMDAAEVRREWVDETGKIPGITYHVWPEK